MTQTQASLETLTGTVERVTYHNPDNGFAVLRIAVRGERELITLVGHLPTATAGEFVEATGRWVVDRQHGQQFKAQVIRTTHPITAEGIERYLGSGMVKGIGPHFAGKLVEAFGEDVFDLIEQSPERLTEVEGIGPKRKDRITESWRNQRVIRSIMVFLHEHGLGTARALQYVRKSLVSRLRISGVRRHSLCR